MIAVQQNRCPQCSHQGMWTFKDQKNRNYALCWRCGYLEGPDEKRSSYGISVLFTRNGAGRIRPFQDPASPQEIKRLQQLAEGPNVDGRYSYVAVFDPPRKRVEIVAGRLNPELPGNLKVEVDGPEIKVHP